MAWNLPGCQVHVAASDMGNGCNGCNQCKQTHFCTDCQYWPIYPCYSPNRPMIDCVMEYTNDKISANSNSGESSAVNMYDALVAEGHDARLLRFSPTNGVNGGHTSPQNAEYWKVGCLGITSPCSKSCETAFVECVQDQGSSGPAAFETCIEASKFTSLGCDETCAPTYNMLKTSEEPTTATFNNFGPDTDTMESQPSSSICTTDTTATPTQAPSPTQAPTPTQPPATTTTVEPEEPEDSGESCVDIWPEKACERLESQGKCEKKGVAKNCPKACGTC